jgi:hypothetical protein
LLRQHKTLKSLLWQTILQGNPCSKFQNNAAAGENVEAPAAAGQKIKTPAEAV